MILYPGCTLGPRKVSASCSRKRTFLLRLRGPYLRTLAPTLKNPYHCSQDGPRREVRLPAVHRTSPQLPGCLCTRHLSEPLPGRPLRCVHTPYIRVEITYLLNMINMGNDAPHDHVKRVCMLRSRQTFCCLYLQVSPAKSERISHRLPHNQPMILSAPC